MKLSQKKQFELYKAMTSPITHLRSDIVQNGSPGSEILDQRLFNLEQQIWRNVKETLNIVENL